MRVALGAVCRAFLRELGVKIVGYVTAIGGVEAAGLEPTSDPRVYTARFARAERSDVRCPDGAAARKMGAAIDAAKRGRDSLGGVVEAAALFVPPGLGSHVQWDRRLDAALAAAVMGLPSVKGVEIGAGFRGAGARGTKAHDAIALRGGDLTRPTNRAGGIEGGISNGAPVVVRAALKPLATTVKPQDSVDLAAGKAAKTRYERSDVCQVPRAVPIVEAAVALVVADALLEKLGGDSLDEVRPRFEALRSARLDDLPMDSEPWRFGYDGRA
jgi:chorismate synthase